MCVFVQLSVIHFLVQEMHTRNETLLQMYGEMSERAEELRLDLMDVKEMYKQQVSVSQGCVMYIHVDLKCFPLCRSKSCSRARRGLKLVKMTYCESLHGSRLTFVRFLSPRT